MYVSRYVDPCTRRDRIDVQTANWNLQMEHLVSAYLDYRTRDCGNGMPYISNQDELILIYHGYLGCSPLHPTVAISLRMLAAYQQSHRTCPRFSIQAQCKTLCHLHDIPYQPYFNTQFSDAFDVYLEILNRVDCIIKAELKHDLPNWHLLKSCLCCFYKLEGEDKLAFEWLATIDGNNSLKRWSSSTYGTSPREDSRTYRSDYWLSRAKVDEFKISTQTRSVSSARINFTRLIIQITRDLMMTGRILYNRGWDPFIQITRDLMMTGRILYNRGWDPFIVLIAGAMRGMFSVFDESRIFIAACRHRFILLACDMVKSGELFVCFLHHCQPC
ncbi:hypothetical protein F4604DRAFT_1594049 [Suillus subluteus]|nr:hypothetical protein F4604DRAFT_1594049 [Suillus subluteus]